VREGGREREGGKEKERRRNRGADRQVGRSEPRAIRRSTNRGLTRSWSIRSARVLPQVSVSLRAGSAIPPLGTWRTWRTNARTRASRASATLAHECRGSAGDPDTEHPRRPPPVFPDEGDAAPPLERSGFRAANAPTAATVALIIIDYTAGISAARDAPPRLFLVFLGSSRSSARARFPRKQPIQIRLVIFNNRSPRRGWIRVRRNRRLRGRESRFASLRATAEPLVRFARAPLMKCEATSARTAPGTPFAE